MRHDRPRPVVYEIAGQAGNDILCKAAMMGCSAVAAAAGTVPMTRVYVPLQFSFS